MSENEISVSCIHLFNEGDDVVVAVEINGEWVEVIREYYPCNDNAISHMVTPSGIKLAIVKKYEQETGNCYVCKGEKKVPDLATAHRLLKCPNCNGSGKAPQRIQD